MANGISSREIHQMVRITATLILTALIGWALWRSTHPRTDSTEARRDRISRLIRHPPPTGPALREPLRTLRWYLRGRPTLQQWSEDLRREQDALLNQGYFVRRRATFKPGTVTAAFTGQLMSAARLNLATDRFLAVTELSDAQLEFVVGTSDLPVLEAIVRGDSNTIALDASP